MEGIRKPEIKTEGLLALVNKISWQDRVEFEFNDTNFLLVIVSKAEIATGRAGEPAEYFTSTAIKGFDIYLHETIPESERRRVLFHEILECNIRDKNLIEGSIAHEMALSEELKFFGPRNWDGKY